MTTIHRDPAMPGRIMRALHWRILAVLLLLMVAVPVSAQQADSVTIRTELIDAVVEVKGEHYVLDHAELEQYPHGLGERIYVSSLESLGFAEISLFDDEDSPDETIDVMLAEFKSSSTRFEVLQRGNDAGVYYALVSFDISGYAGYFYIEVAENIEGNVDLLQGFYNLNSDFGEQLDLVRGDVTIDGVPFLNAPVINVESLVLEHQQHLSELAATPVVDSIVLRGYPEMVSVTSPVQVYDHFTSAVLECVFFHSASGKSKGLIGYLKDAGPSAEDVVRTIADNPPEGEADPQEIEIQRLNSDEAIGLYLVSSDDGEMLMVISVTWYEEGVWLIESFAAPPDDFLEEYRDVRSHVMIGDRALFDTIDIEAFVNDAMVAP